MVKKTLFNVQFDDFSFKDLFMFIDETIKKGKPKYIITCNVDHLVKLTKNSDFLKVYQGADAIVADGKPIIWASRLLNKPLRQKVSGSDILPILGNEFEKKKYKIFFLGAAEGVAERAKIELCKKFTNLQIIGCYSPPIGFENNKEENQKTIDIIRELNPDIIFVGFGAPKQEIWISKYKEIYNVPVSIGIGGTFDILAGDIKRAPIYFQKIGLEWLWRLCSEPRRLWKRYLIEDLKFLGILFKELKKH